MDQNPVRLKEIKPALSGYLRQSMLLLGKDPVPDDEVIHDVRVLMKKARATLRLLAPGLDHNSVRKDILSLKEIGRKMSGMRELSVHRKNLRNLRKNHPDLFHELTVNEKIKMLIKKPEPFTLEDKFLKTELPAIVALLRKTGFRIRFYSMGRIDEVLLLKSLELSFKRVVDIYLTCRNDSDPDHLHEFRKRSKDFLSQLSFFRPLNPRHIKTLEKKIDTLAQNLGKFNDLYQLIRALEYNYAPNSNPPALDELVVIIRNRQDRYLSKIWTDAYRLFSPGRKLATLLGFKMLAI